VVGKNINLLSLTGTQFIVFNVSSAHNIKKGRKV